MTPDIDKIKKSLDALKARVLEDLGIECRWYVLQPPTTDLQIAVKTEEINGEAGFLELTWKKDRWAGEGHNLAGIMNSIFGAIERYKGGESA